MKAFYASSVMPSATVTNQREDTFLTKVGEATVTFGENKNYIITACAIIFILFMFYSGIGSKNKTISNLESNIQDLEFRIGELENQLNEVESTIEENASKISDLEDSINY